MNYLQRISIIKENALAFVLRLHIGKGFYKYTVNHDIEKHPAAILYGTWAIVYLSQLTGSRSVKTINKSDVLKALGSYRRADGLFFPPELNNIKFPKSKEYMFLHCYNYSVGACLILDENYDFQSKYMDFYLKADNLKRWLNQRSLERPWEESNNIVNVASYLALCNDNGHPSAKERLYQMLEWHNTVQNPITGGFENFSRSRKNVLQSMAGAVHNFHIHHYLNEPMNYESIIGRNVIPYLFEGPLTACLSIDFVELACQTIHYIEDSHELEQALLFHLEALLKYQNEDGGFYENESQRKPTRANGMIEQKASSNSYATWFRMCSIGMISTTLLGDNSENWKFRKTLGMGYYTPRKYRIIENPKLDSKVQWKYKKLNFPSILQKHIIETGVRLLK